MISMKWPPISCQSVFHFKPSGRTDGGAARRDGRIACIAASARRPFACRQLIRYGASPLLPAAAVCCQPPPGEFYYHLTPRRRLGELVVVAVLLPLLESIILARQSGRTTARRAARKSRRMPESNDSRRRRWSASDIGGRVKRLALCFPENLFHKKLATRARLEPAKGSAIHAAAPIAGSSGASLPPGERQQTQHTFRDV